MKGTHGVRYGGASSLGSSLKGGSRIGLILRGRVTRIGSGLFGGSRGRVTKIRGGLFGGSRGRVARIRSGLFGARVGSNISL